MKKALSLLLAVVMAFGCMSTAFADTYTDSIASADGTPIQFESGDIISGNVTLENGTTAIIPQGVTVNVAPGTNFIVNGTLINNGTLVLQSGRSLSANGTGSVISDRAVMTVNSILTNSGTITNEGSIVNPNNIYNGETGILQTLVLVPATKASDALHPYHVRVAPLTMTEDEFKNDPDAAFANSAVNVGSDAYVKSGSSLFFTLDFEDEAVDPTKFGVYGNGVRVYREMNGYQVTPVGESVSITYGDYVRENLLKQIKIKLPYGEGYRVVAYGYTLDQATMENIEYIYADYGSTVSFRVEVYQGWQDSDYLVTIGGQDPSVQADDSLISGPDAYGYYTIRDITDTKAAQGAYDIYVAGVVADETQDMIMRILTAVRQIFETIIDIFRTFFESLGGMFGGLGGGNTTTPPATTTPSVTVPVTPTV